MGPGALRARIAGVVERAFPDRAAALLTVVDRWLWLGRETRTGRRTQRCEACLRGKSKARSVLAGSRRLAWLPGKRPSWHPEEGIPPPVAICPACAILLAEALPLPEGSTRVVDTAALVDVVRAVRSDGADDAEALVAAIEARRTEALELQASDGLGCSTCDAGTPRILHGPVRSIPPLCRDCLRAVVAAHRRTHHTVRDSRRDSDLRSLEDAILARGSADSGHE